MPKILVADPLAQAGIDVLKTIGDVDVKQKLSIEELVAIIGDYEAIVVRSETKVTAEVIQAGNQLQVIGRAGVGVDNIDLDAATQKGIAVVNAPTGNTVAAAEHTIAMMMSLARNVPQADASLRRGEWTRSAFTGIEVRDRTLGIVGLGKVGTEVARRAIGLQMKVQGFDPFISQEHARIIGIELVQLEQIFKESDFICLHTPLTEATRGLIGESQIAMMKPGVRILNVARGELIDEQALAKALEDGRVSGAALDVFSEEPPNNNPLVGNNKVIVTPHLGAATEEAQTEVAKEVSEQVVTVLQGQSARYTVNAPFVLPESQAILAPYIEAASCAGKVATQLANGQLKSISLKYEGDIANYDSNILKSACLMGILAPISEEKVNLVNAELIASQKGLTITEHKVPVAQQYGSIVTVQMETTDGQTEVAVTHIRGESHIVLVNNHWVDIVASSGYMLFTDHQDRPGMIGAVGTITGKHNINIGFMEVGRQEARGRATMILGLDDSLPESVLSEINDLPDVFRTSLVHL